MENCASRTTSTERNVRAAPAIARSWAAASPAASASIAPGTNTGTTSTAMPRAAAASRSSSAIEASEGSNVATRPTRAPIASASSSIASFGFSVGSATARFAASISAPNAEHV